MPHVWFPGAERVSGGTRQEHGAVIIDGQQVGSTLQCPHCGGHFLSVRGSGHKRTFCLCCNAVTCGAKACVESCVPTEKMLEEIERKASREVRIGI